MEHQKSGILNKPMLLLMESVDNKDKLQAQLPAAQESMEPVSQAQELKTFKELPEDQRQAQSQDPLTKQLLREFTKAELDLEFTKVEAVLEYTKVDKVEVDQALVFTNRVLISPISLEVINQGHIKDHHTLLAHIVPLPKQDNQGKQVNQGRQDRVAQVTSTVTSAND